MSRVRRRTASSIKKGLRICAISIKVAVTIKSRSEMNRCPGIQFTRALKLDIFYILFQVNKY